MSHPGPPHPGPHTHVLEVALRTSRGGMHVGGVVQVAAGATTQDWDEGGGGRPPALQSEGGRGLPSQSTHTTSRVVAPGRGAQPTAWAGFTALPFATVQGLQSPTCHARMSSGHGNRLQGRV